MPNERRLVGVADLSRDRSRLRVTGTDRVAYLHGQCTNDIKSLAVGQSCYAVFLNAKGKMRGDAHVACVKDAFMLETSVGLQPSLEKFIITEDVTIDDVSGARGEWLVVGTATVTLPAGAVTFSHPLGVGVISALPLVATLGAEALEVMRIEAGIPKWGVEIDENTIPVEAGLAGRAISYDKGCYIGQETIARIKTYGHVNRQLVQLSVDSDELPVKGAKILADEKEAGQVTSATYSNRLGKMLALGYVRREFAITGTKLKINQQSAEVLKLCGE